MSSLCFALIYFLILHKLRGLGKKCLAEISLQIQKDFLLIYPAFILFPFEDKKG